MINPVAKAPSELRGSQFTEYSSGLKGSELEKNNDDKWGILSILEKSKPDIISYNPYYEDKSPFILTIEISKKGVFILLKNGTVLRLVGDSSNKIDNIYQTGQIPNIVKIKTTIIDISCGTEHSLARGRDCKIYSWGINSFGQLGLDECKVGPNSEVVEPTFIKKFSEWKIKQICAHNYNSFCFDENNVLFGFGKVRIAIYLLHRMIKDKSNYQVQIRKYQFLKLWEILLLIKGKI